MQNDDFDWDIFGKASVDYSATKILSAMKDSSAALAVIGQEITNLKAIVGDSSFWWWFLCGLTIGLWLIGAILGLLIAVFLYFKIDAQGARHAMLPPIVQQMHHPENMQQAVLQAPKEQQEQQQGEQNRQQQIPPQALQGNRRQPLEAQDVENRNQAMQHNHELQHDQELQQDQSVHPKRRGRPPGRKAKKQEEEQIGEDEQEEPVPVAKTRARSHHQ